MKRTKIKNIFTDGKFHHIGLAVGSIDKDLDKIYDPIQKVMVAFVDLGGIKIELVEPKSDTSPARNFVGKGIYHICFQVKDILKSIQKAKKNGFMLVASPVPAKAFEGKKIAWIISPTFGLVELLEE